MILPAGLGLLIALAGGARDAAAAAVAPPPNEGAAVDWNETRGHLLLRYHGRVILDATVTAQDAEGRELADATIKLEPTATRDDKGKVEQRLALAPIQAPEGTQLLLRGTVSGSGEAFPAETPCESQRRFSCVRNSVGLSRNLRNNAVYDRRWDRVLTGPADGQTRIVPTRKSDGSVEFSWRSRAPRVEFVLRPRFYQKHKDVKYFEPWTYKVWRGSLTGYCTWWAYRGGFTQGVLDQLLAVFVEKHLPDFGYQYMRICPFWEESLVGSGWGLAAGRGGAGSGGRFLAGFDARRSWGGPSWGMLPFCFQRLWAQGRVRSQQSPPGIAEAGLHKIGPF